jgi:hypothetical protein
MNNILRQLIRFTFFVLNIFIQIENYIQRKRTIRVLKGMRVPVHSPAGYEDQVSDLLNAYSRMKRPTWVQTSGTRSEPKKIPYDEQRIKAINKTFLKSMITLTSHLEGVKTFFAFGSLDKDHSLTSSMLDEKKKPAHIELLQAPYRYLGLPDGKKLRKITGDLAARVAVLLVSRPRIIYATNPSTISHFIDEVLSHKNEIQENIRRLLSEEEMLRSLLTLQDGDGLKSLELFVSKREISAIDVFPALKAYITWDGGYVFPFLERLKKDLPRCEHIPMYSMSTETIESLPHRIKGRIVFLPVMKGVLPEFMDNDGNIWAAHEVQPGFTYTLIVTDQWGLSRYDTSDQFEVTEIVDGLPHIRFRRRRNITASVTGEKISEEQVLEMNLRLKTKFPELQHHSFSLFSIIDNDSVGYKLALLGGEVNDTDIISHAAEEILSTINPEYKTKVHSGRIQKMEVLKLTVSELAGIMGQKQQWESQFKVIPLYEKPVRKNQ